MTDLADTPSPEEFKHEDAWVWAEFSAIDLGGYKFETIGHEPQIELLRDNSPRQCFCKSTQAYGTQAYVIKALHGLIYKKFPKGILYLFPTLDDVTDFSTTRFKPLIKDNYKSIGRYVRDTDRANLKKIGKGHLYFRGGRMTQTLEDGRRGSSRLLSVPVDWVIFDEFDHMDQQARELAFGRMADSDFKWETYLGNPTIPDYGVDKVFRESDQRYWELKCDACSKFTNLKLEFLSNPPGQIKWAKINGEERVIRACRNCGHELDPREGEWIAQYPENAKDIVGRTISHMEHLKTDLKRFLEVWEDPATDKTQFYNLDLGEAYVDAENKLHINDVYRCCSRDPMERSSRIARCAGVDVGKHVFHIVIGYPVKKKNMYKITWVGRVTKFEEIHDVFARYNVKMAVIDAEPETHKARDFQANEEAKIYLCDYQERLRTGQKIDEKGGTITVRRTEICDATHRIVTTGGQLEIPRRCAEIELYAKQMSNIAKVLETDDKTGRSEFRYRKTGAEGDHYRHATNYFYLACQEPSFEFMMSQSMTSNNVHSYMQADRLRQKDKNSGNYDPLGAYSHRQQQLF